MSKKKTRDDFSADTKRRAADRVNSLCSMCFQLTKAASAESSKSVSNLGVAAHICAAAPGPGARRYDPTMTSDQRSSIENCIWLCKDHADLIDTDEVTYTKEVLIKIKKIAEDRSTKALADKETKIQIIKSSGFDVTKTREILHEKVVAGDFFELKQLLDSMDISVDSDDIVDLHDFFEIIYSFYCDRTTLDTKIDEYKNRGNKSYINQICELFAQHFEADYLAKIIELCTDADTRAIATHVVNGTVEGDIITLQTEKIGEEEVQKIKLVSKGSLLHKLASNFAVHRGINSIQNADGSELDSYAEEFVYKQKKMVLELSIKAVKNLNLKEQQIEIFDEYKTILSSLDKIKILTADIQAFFFARLLLIATNLNDAQAFERLYAECCGEVRENLKIKEIVLYEMILRDVTKVDFAEVRRFCEAIKGYKLINTYLNKLMEYAPIEAEKIINTHQFLFSVHSMFLKTYIRLKRDIRKFASFSATKFLSGYKDHYKDDLAFHIYVAFYISKKNKSAFEKEVQWLDKNIAKMQGNDLNNLEMLIEIYRRAKRYDKLLKLDTFLPPNYFRLYIASALHNSKQIENIKHAKRIYVEVLAQEPTMEGLCRSLSSCCYLIGEIQEAKEYILKEISLAGKKEDYFNLLQLRYETNEITIDKHIEKAKEFQDYQIDHLIGGFYLDNDLKKEAKQFLLRSLLVDDTNIYCMNGYMSAVLGEGKEKPPKNIGAGVTAQLKNEKGKVLLVSIHGESSFPKSSSNKFALCNHYKESDRVVEDLIMAKVGDEIMYKSVAYKVEVLNWNEVVFYGFIMSELIKHKRVTAVQGESTEQVVEKLTELLREQTKHKNDVIKKYNESAMPWPTTLLVKYVGRDYLTTYSFLYYENTKKIRNLNSNCVLPNKPQFVLSFETIYALAIFDIDGKTLKEKNCLIPLSIKRKMSKEVDELIAQSKNERAVGQAVLVNDKLVLDVVNDERRKASLKFNNRIKRLLEEVPTAEMEYSYVPENDIKRAFAEHKMFMESDILGCAQSEADRVLVGDDSFLSAVIVSEKANAIGLNRFLAVLDLDVIRHLECIKQLARMNFGNYFTIDVYEHIKKKIIEEKDGEMQKKSIDELYKFFTADYIDMTVQPDLWKHNSAIIHNLGFQMELHKVDAGDEFDRILLRAIVYNFSKEQPEEFKRKQEDITKRLRSQLIQEDGKMYIRTWLEPADEKNLILDKAFMYEEHVYR